MKLMHPKSRLTVEADADHAHMYESQGWVEPGGDVCPTCGASGDQPCVTANGNETSPHALRG